MLEFTHMFNVYALHTDIALVYFYLSQSTRKLMFFLLNWNVNVVYMQLLLGEISLNFP